MRAAASGFQSFETKFRLQWPRASGVGMTAKPRVLLVEDTPSILRLYHEFLVKLDVELIDADTGPRAQAALRETIPDVVLLDLELPDVNGIEILRTIRS